MTSDEIINYCLQNLPDTILVNSWGEQGIFYNPNHTLKRGIYVLTIKEKDGEHDEASKLNRGNIYRVNIGIRKETFVSLFGKTPNRPLKGCIVDLPYDFTKTDELLPHPIYAWMSWICVLNPTEDTFERLIPLIQEAYTFAKEKYRKRKK
ncbi:MAG: hypothetical protein K2O23_01540 [Anaeroplasmataceae bacterium]|nr:hypothetical protein [Anaeroplasmataceae bacterium]